MSAVIGREAGRGERSDPTRYNNDLAPILKERRNWNWVNYSTVWMGMIHNMVLYTTVAGLVGAGMSPWRAIGMVAVANIILIAAMQGNSIAGAKYGLSFPVLGYIGGALGPVAGIMIADLYLIRRRNYDLHSFYDRRGMYGSSGGWNPKALVATALGIIVAFVGLVVPALSVMLSYSWFLGLAVAFVAYTFLMRAERAESDEFAEPAPEIAEELQQADSGAAGRDLRRRASARRRRETPAAQRPSGEAGRERAGP